MLFDLFRLDSVNTPFASKHSFSHFHPILAANLILYCIYWSGQLQFPAGVILLHDESDNVDEQARMVVVMKSVMMIISVGDCDCDELYAD